VDETAKRLLFFGNSFSVYDDVPGHVRSLAALAGHPAPLVVADLALGTDLAYHIGQVDSYPENNVAHASLDGTNTWDWVVIQGYSTEATHLRDPAVFKANALALFQRVKDHASGKGVGVSPLLFQTWAREPLLATTSVSRVGSWLRNPAPTTCCPAAFRFGMPTTERGRLAWQT
jgi:hypothetical protein